MALYRANGWELRRVANRRKSCSDKKTGQELARALVPWHNAVFAPNATVRVTDCGAKGLGLVARRDLSVSKCAR